MKVINMSIVERFTMIKNNFFIPILVAVLISAAFMTTQNASAHQDPPSCNNTAAGSGLSVFNTANGILNAVIQGQMVKGQADLQELNDSGQIVRCAFDGGEISSPAFNGTWNITAPNGSTTLVNNGDIPCIGGTFNTGDQLIPTDDCDDATTGTFSNFSTLYQTDCADFEGNGNTAGAGTLRWSAIFTGRSHQNALDTTDAIKSDELILPCTISNYNFTTLSSPVNATQTIPVINPSDTVTINAVSGIDGTVNVTAVVRDPSNNPLDTPVCNS